MKFKIRFVDQIVGVSIIFSLLALGFVTVMLGRSQRWFANDVSFTTALPTAGGLSRNMPVQYRGFTIGNVSSFRLTEDSNVEVVFFIYEEYRDRAREGSLVEMMISPIGLGNQFLFHAGRGALLPEGAFIPIAGSAEALELVRLGLAEEPRHDDSISLIMARVNSMMDDLGLIVANVSEALGEGSDATEIGRMLGSLQRTLAEAEALPQTVNYAVIAATAALDELQTEITPILANVGVITEELTRPDGILFTVLDTEGEVFQYLLESLASVTGILENLDRVTAFLPSQLPHIAGLIIDLRTTMATAEEVLVALTNNPLLRGGVPERPLTRDTGPRNVRF